VSGTKLENYSEIKIHESSVIPCDTADKNSPRVMRKSIKEGFIKGNAENFEMKRSTQAFKREKQTESIQAKLQSGEESPNSPDG
jgi:hypothetical protein